MTIAAVYLRVSKSDEQDDESLTIETQRRRIAALCEARGWTYGPEYLDEGVSATKSRGTSTRWSEMLSHVGTGRFDVIVARDLDRLLRTLQDERGLAMLFVTHNIALARHIASRVAVLNAGRIVDDGPVDMVLENPQHTYTQELLTNVPSL